jgi:hypothetical protein
LERHAGSLSLSPFPFWNGHQNTQDCAKKLSAMRVEELFAQARNITQE